MATPALASAPLPLTIRPAVPADAAECGRICYQAFYAISTKHNFPPDVMQQQEAVEFLHAMFSHPQMYCLVAEEGGRIIGSNCLDERDRISGIGPITIDPEGQNRGAGRALMQAALERIRSQRQGGARLVQAAFHSRSLALYASLGFVVREPLVVMNGPALHLRLEGCTVRPAVEPDLEACACVCLQVHGHDRTGALRDAIQEGSAVVCERAGRITAYASILGFYGHAVAQSTYDLQALIAAADGFAGSGILVPSRNAELFRWCLQNGLRVVQPMTLMSLGLYNEPQGAYLPSVSF